MWRLTLWYPVDFYPLGEPGVEDAILTIRELAALLKIGEKTAYTMAQNGELPGFKVRDQWRFRRADIDAWIDKKLRAASDVDDANDTEEEL